MLTWAERLALWNQYELLKHLDPTQAQTYEVSQEILASGYEQYYSQLNISISQESVPSAVTGEVEKILDLFRTIKFSCQRLGYVPTASTAEFGGFDANEPSEHYAIAHFLRRKKKLWDELKAQPDNSHSSASLPIYRAMVSEWQRLGEKRDLTEAEIEQIANAR